MHMLVVAPQEYVNIYSTCRISILSRDRFSPAPFSGPARHHRGPGGQRQRAAPPAGADAAAAARTARRASGVWVKGLGCRVEVHPTHTHTHT